MNTPVKLLDERLNMMGVNLKGVSLGSNPGNIENVAEEINKALIRLSSGDYEEVVNID